MSTERRLSSWGVSLLCCLHFWLIFAGSQPLLGHLTACSDAPTSFVRLFAYFINFSVWSLITILAATSRTCEFRCAPLDSH
ncbi:hypothetical protein L596_022222 [Steinernema carpocapsae]|uniref:Uncharacterized protein n=1 Tax=Steinernema carpocapsae TaxID=34508 RepID=A0A4V6XVX2_STECR|nr:hypothetical protein L596_022222 [Steinernema carpocapsae]